MTHHDGHGHDHDGTTGQDPNVDYDGEYTDKDPVDTGDVKPDDEGEYTDSELPADAVDPAKD